MKAKLKRSDRSSEILRFCLSSIRCWILYAYREYKSVIYHAILANRVDRVDSMMATFDGIVFTVVKHICLCRKCQEMRSNQLRRLTDRSLGGQTRSLSRQVTSRVSRAKKRKLISLTIKPSRVIGQQDLLADRPSLNFHEHIGSAKPPHYQSLAALAAGSTSLLITKCPEATQHLAD